MAEASAAAFPVLSVLLAVPLAGVVAVAAGGRSPAAAKATALAFTLAAFGASVAVLAGFDFADPGLQLVERYPWIGALGISYLVGVDGVSLPLVLLTTVLFLLTVVYSWGVTHRVREFYAMLLLLEFGLLGVFVTLDLLIFFVFWELVLIPMYFVIGIWGGPRKDYAAIKFFIYTHLGSLVMLLGFIFLYFEASARLGAPTASMLDIAPAVRDLALTAQLAVFGAFLFAFGVKLPVVPLHTWLPDAHVEAPTEGSVILAGLLLKMGGYGLIRIAMGLLPDAAQAFGPLMMLIGIVTILYAAFVCLAQRDLKRLVAYSSVSHMGAVVLGLGAFNQLAFGGAVYMLFAHGLSSAALFMLSGSVHHLAGTRLIPRLGGLAARMPVWTFMLASASLAAAGLPGMALFVSEFTILLGAYEAIGLLVLAPALSLALTAGYFLWALQRAAFGPLRPGLEAAHDLPRFEAAALAALVVLLILFGVFPGVLLNPAGASGALILSAPPPGGGAA